VPVVLAGSSIAPDLASGGGAITAFAGSVHECTASAIDVKKGRLEGAAGSRFLRVRALNENSEPCATQGWTRYRFMTQSAPVGFMSERNPGFDLTKPPVVIPANGKAKSVLSWVSPSVVPRHRCHPRAATFVVIRIRSIQHLFMVRLHVKVCTTERFRPSGTRLKVG
jgi:hypothetical protein